MPVGLNERFAKFIIRNWTQNNHSLEDIPCVYAILSCDVIDHTTNVAYVGSTTKLFSRYKSHKVPAKIQSEGRINILYYLPMNKGFYDYEIKLIKKLKPKFNYQHKGAV